MKKFSSFIIPTLYILVLFVLLLDVYRSGRTSITYLHVSSRIIEIWAIGLIIFARWYLKQPLPPLLSKFNTYFVLPITVISGVVLTIWGYIAPPNYVYSITLLQYTQIVFIAVFSSIIWLISHSNAWFTKHFQKIIFLGSIAYLAYSFIVSLFPRDIFIKFSQEDWLIEYLQVVILLLGTIWAIKIAKKLMKQKDIFNVSIFSFIGFVLFFVAGDEISWGQRLLHLTTPDSLNTINTQGEITVHNITKIVDYVGMTYIAVGFIGTYAWVLQQLFPRLNKVPFSYYIPQWYCCLFFFLGFAYNFYAIAYFNSPFRVWSETAELMLYSGVAFTILATLLNLKKKS